jgi:hypothetical protein
VKGFLFVDVILNHKFHLPDDIARERETELPCCDLPILQRS